MKRYNPRVIHSYLSLVAATTCFFLSSLSVPSAFCLSAELHETVDELTGRADKALSFDKELAITLYEQALQLAPDNPKLLYKLGYACYTTGQYARTIKTLERQLDVAQPTAETVAYLALSYLQIGNKWKALTTVNGALALDPFLHITQYATGTVFLAQDLDRYTDRAITCLEKATWLAPKDENSYINLGVAYSRKGRIRDAVTSLKRALRLNPNNPQAWLKLGTVYEQAGLQASASDCFKKAHVLAPELSAVKTFSDKKQPEEKLADIATKQDEVLNPVEHPELVQRAQSIALRDGVSVDQVQKITKKEWGWLVLFKKPRDSAIPWYTVAIFQRDRWFTGIEARAYPLGYEIVHGKFAAPSADRSKLALFRYEHYLKRISGSKELHEGVFEPVEFVSPCTLFVWDTKKETMEAICEAEYGIWHPIHWEKDRIAFIDSKGGEFSGAVVTVDLKTREIRYLNGKGILLAVSPDGKQVAWISPGLPP